MNAGYSTAVIRKSELVNFLFVVGFPVFGYGSYIGQKQGISKGMIVSVAPFVALILFHFIDAIYRRRIQRSLTTTWWLCMAYMVTLVISMVVALRGGIPGVNMGNMLLSSLVFIAPFNAALVVLVHNRNNDKFDLGRLVFMGLGLLLAINIMGYVLGVQSYGHSFEGRANFPFIRGIYTGVHVLAIWALMLLLKMKAPGRRPVVFMLSLVAFGICLFFMMKINSRLSFMIFLMLFALFITRAIKVVRGLYTISLFTMPLLLSFSLLVYQVLSTPFFTTILERVSKEDVTTFNGRSYIWNAVGDWAMYDQRGLVFGNGYKGHYKLHMLDFVAVLWDEPHAYNLHSHSTFAEVFVAQGIVGVLLLYIILWRGFKYYRRQYLDDTPLAPMFAGLVYILFIWQLDIFCYGVEIGHSILFIILAPLCIRELPQAGPGMGTPS